MYVAHTGLPSGGGLTALTAAWATAIATMAAVNVSLHSAFRWPLLALAAVGAGGLVLAALSR